MSNKKEGDLSDFHRNDSLPVLHIDSAYVSHRDDKIVFVNFTSNLPGGNFEQARMMIRDQDLQGLINGMCDVINYYPKKPSGKQSSPKNKK